MAATGASRGAVWIVGLAGLMLGVLVGSFLGRSSTHSLEVELANTRKELEEAKKNAMAPGSALAQGLRRMLTARGPEAGDRSEVKVEADAKAVAAGDGASPTPSANGDTPRVHPIRDSAPNSEERKKMLDTLAGTWRLRSTQAKASFLEAADLNAEQKAGMNKVVAELNVAVKSVVEEALASGKFKEKPESRDVVDMMVSMGEVYLQTDEHLRQVLNQEQMATASEQGFDIMSQVDPEVVMPLLLQLDPNGTVTEDDEE